MGHKSVCLHCRKAFNIGTNSNDFKDKVCPECGNKLVYFNHKFRPPKRNDLKAWKVVSFLYDHGFNYQHIYKDLSISNKINKDSSNNYVNYPETMEEAKEFVQEYRNQARKLEE